MSILGNGSWQCSQPVKFYGGNVTVTGSRYAFGTDESVFSRFMSTSGYGKGVGVPYGYSFPYAIYNPPREGDFASHDFDGEGTLTLSSLAQGVACSGQLDGEGELNPLLSALSFVVAALSGQGQINANAICGSIMEASLEGSGGIDPATSFVSLCTMLAQISGEGELSEGTLTLCVALAAEIDGEGSLQQLGELALLLKMSATLEGEGGINPSTLSLITTLASSLSGAGTIYSASIKGLLWASALLSGTGVFVGTMRGDVYMSAAITLTGGTLTTTGIAQAVWAALASSNNDSGTMGEKLNAAGTAGDPWTAELPGSYAEGTAGHLFGDLKTLVEFLVASVKNKKVLRKAGSTWYLAIRDEGDSADILLKPLKDKDGAEITDLQAGTLAQELESSV